MKNDSHGKELLTRTWDAVVVGTGIGGATLGHALAKSGRSVLFCEKGRSYLSDPDPLVGDWLEALVDGMGDGLTAEHRSRAGRASEMIADVTTSKARFLQPVLGCGTGGSSALYGMVMERFFPADFTPARYFPDAPGANLPDAWPITYDELKPYYTQAETLYGVRATLDSLRPVGESRGILEPPRLSATNEELVERFRARGLHPYGIPMACDYAPACQECLGYICPRHCKRDSVTSCLEPAMRQYGAELLSQCEIESLDADKGRIAGLRGRWHDQPIQLKARTVFLAAGAVQTPVLLLRSGGRTGLANRSGQVGRNLMRHFLDYYIVYPNNAPTTGFVKQIAFNDFYFADGMKFGTIQSNGRFPPIKSIANITRENLQQTWSPLGRLFPLVRRLVERRVKSLLEGGYVLAAFMEDLPYEANQIGLSGDQRQVTMKYTIPPHDRARLAHYRRKIVSVLQPHPFYSIPMAEKNRVLGHVCGTCRFGDDPTTSVLNRNNRAHDVENLYIVDGSFLPSSSGTNPALTIAANALRVADAIATLP